jgi:hypothetical protein
MKRIPATVGVVVLLVYMLAGCSTSPVERKENVTRSVADLRSELLKTRGQIDQTLNSLQQLVIASPSNISQAYKQYAQDVEALKQQARQMQRDSTEMRAQSERWLSTWQKSQRDIQNAELKRISEQRRNEVAARFHNINAAYDQAQAAFMAFLKNLDDVKTAIGNDLTPQGVALVAGTRIVENANANGGQVKQIIDRAINEFDGLMVALGPEPITR